MVGDQSIVVLKSSVMQDGAKGPACAGLNLNNNQKWDD